MPILFKTIYRDLFKSNLACTEKLTEEIINPISKKILVNKETTVLLWPP